MSETRPWLVVGLGNPGAQYADTRHNVGHMTVDVLAARCGAHLTSHKSGTHVADVRLGVLPGGVPGPRVVLAVSDGYMNITGGPVSRLMTFLGVDAEHLLVLHDELDLPAHELRLKRGGGEGGHNGLKSISQSIGTKDYHRLRIGIGRPPGRQDPADYVLARITAKDRPEVDVTVEQAADVVEDVVLRGFSQAQMSLHTA
ncbi:aminoacyl-tRNA hydrolase [Schaalia sp. 19OD2882]|uniref:aminoacyl-tRNA hydrolase n=1 Tax=Schaalia sp. 19OD2882 TaxID=2794089 RepID=UPI001C1F01A4|nr:aminoacyl-tRNA hydrolase [Schaalia sp. 19OD2882]QWW19152.1 aminoacyl-tRNA hydrolase [Schaalia sp. 19OD2882]